MYQPLSGYKVIDCSRLLPYQFCTLLLADLGAEVLKIEEPGKGDYGRWADLKTPGKENPVFLMINRNKRSMTLKLKHKVGREIFKKLALQYDIVFESFRPGVMERLGIGYQAIKEINPKIIYCSGTGYGQTGPYRHKPGHDINYISIAGILGVTGMHTGRPVIPGIPIADMVGGGIFPALVMVAALLGRERTGRGQYIDVAMADVMTSLNIVSLSWALSQNAGEKRRLYNIVGNSLCYNIFKTKDDKFVSIGNLEPKFWENFCRAIGRKDLIEKNYAAYQEKEETTETLKTIFSSKTQSEWVELMKEVDNCFTPVHTPKETLEDPHVNERGLITDMQDARRGRSTQIRFPVLFSEDLDYKRSPAPMLGEHTVEILKDIGYNSDAIERLKKEGVI